MRGFSRRQQPLRIRPIDGNCRFRTPTDLLARGAVRQFTHTQDAALCHHCGSGRRFTAIGGRIDRSCLPGPLLSGAHDILVDAHVELPRNTLRLRSSTTLTSMRRVLRPFLHRPCRDPSPLTYSETTRALQTPLLGTGCRCFLAVTHRSLLQDSNIQIAAVCLRHRSWHSHTTAPARRNYGGTDNKQASGCSILPATHS